MQSRFDDIEPEILRKLMLEVRTKLGLSQTSVGEKIGISHASLSSIESGKTNPRKGTRLRIIQFLDEHSDIIDQGIGKVSEEQAHWNLLADDFEMLVKILRSDLPGEKKALRFASTVSSYDSEIKLLLKDANE